MLKRVSARTCAASMLLLAAPGTIAADQERRCEHAEHAGVVRVATFNAFLNRSELGELVGDLSDPNDQLGEGASDTQIRAVAEIIQRVRPHVLLLNEFDRDLQGDALRLFQKNYLSVSQNGARPIHYPFVFNGPSNTGVPSGFDLNNDGEIGGADDAFGFGAFEGQFAMALVSRYPIDRHRVRTFQTFRWADMPGALLPADPEDADGDGNLEDWYSSGELEVVRLSSKSHWDIPVMIHNRTIHILAAHPTPPVFDGPEDRNGRRNHDETRFWADYVTPGRGDYIYDDTEGGPAAASGGLPEGDQFVIVGDYNADPLDGDSTQGAINQLLVNLQITDSKPSSEGAAEDATAEAQANATHRAEPAMDTGDFNPANPGNLRTDYALPSSHLPVAEQVRRQPCRGCRGVFWPAADDPLRYLVGDGFPVVSSDHHLVWVDVLIAPCHR